MFIRETQRIQICFQISNRLLISVLEELNCPIGKLLQAVAVAAAETGTAMSMVLQEVTPREEMEPLPLARTQVQVEVALRAKAGRRVSELLSSVLAAALQA